MRIAIYTDTYFPQINGVVNVVHMLATALTARGHEVGVFTLSSESAEALQGRPEIDCGVVSPRRVLGFGVDTEHFPHES